MAYTFPAVTINNMTFTARRWGQFPTITYLAGGTAGSETVALASNLGNISVTIEDGVSTNAQIKAAVEAALGVAVQSLYPSDLVSIAIASGHESDAASAVSAQAMTGAAATPAPSDDVATLPAKSLLDTVIDWSINRMFYRTLTANSTFTFVNAADGMEIVVVLTNTASNRTVAWPSGIKWTGGSAPTQTTGAKSDVYVFRKLGSVIYGTYVQNLS